MTIAFLAAILAFPQSVTPEVDTFIKTFSYAATNVDLVPDSKGNFPHRAELAKALLALQATSDDTLSRAFTLLDKNQSKRRLVAGDLLLLIAFDVPATTDWKTADASLMRNALEPIQVGGNPDAAWSSPAWPWAKSGDGKWTLGPYALSDAPWNRSLAAELGLFEGKFKRRTL